VTIRPPIKIVFFGTPAYAVPSLEALANDARYEIVLVVTQPDRPAGRGRNLQAPPVKLCAERLGISTYQPASLREAAARLPLAAAAADVFVVAAYGLIFGSKTLALPRFACLNLHASLLPAYRGASPVAAAILSGDTITGVSLMMMETGLDTGPVVDRVVVPIAPSDTAESLTARLGDAAAHLVVSSIPEFLRGELQPRPQDVAAATKTRPLIKDDGWLNWRDTAIHLDRRVRAMWPWPRAWTTFRGEPLQIHSATALDLDLGSPDGSIRLKDDRLLAACGNGALCLDLVQPAGGKAMAGAAWASGRRIDTGECLGLDGAPESPLALITSA
jgi:methionyl-tRNA formyltransferase